MSEENTPPEEETIMKFPCEFSIKTMGLAGNNFDAVVLELVKQHAPEIDASAIKIKTSKTGKYVSVSINLQAQSKKQMDAIYQALGACELVLMSL